MLTTRYIRAFNPRQANFTAIWDASNPLGNGSIPADAASMASWVDLTTNGNTLSQATGAAQPIYKTAIVNRLNILRFNGSSQYLSVANNASNQFATNDSVSIFGIAACDTPTGGVNQGIIAKGQFPTGGFLSFVTNATGLLNFTATTIASYAATSAFVANTFQSFSEIYDATSGVTFYKNGANSNFVAGTGLAASSQILTVGAGALGAGNFFDGDMQFLALLKGVANAALINSMNLWMRQRVAI